MQTKCNPWRNPDGMRTRCQHPAAIPYPYPSTQSPVRGNPRRPRTRRGTSGSYSHRKRWRRRRNANADAKVDMPGAASERRDEQRNDGAQKDLDRPQIDGLRRKRDYDYDRRSGSTVTPPGQLAVFPIIADREIFARGELSLSTVDAPRGRSGNGMDVGTLPEPAVPDDRKPWGHDLPASPNRCRRPRAIGGRQVRFQLRPDQSPSWQ